MARSWTLSATAPSSLSAEKRRTPKKPVDGSNGPWHTCRCLARPGHPGRWKHLPGHLDLVAVEPHGVSREEAPRRSVRPARDRRGRRPSKLGRRLGNTDWITDQGTDGGSPIPRGTGWSAVRGGCAGYSSEEGVTKARCFGTAPFVFLGLDYPTCGSLCQVRL